MEGVMGPGAASPSQLGRQRVYLLLLIFSGFQLIGMARSQPSSGLSSVAFDQGYSNLWGPQHQTLSADKSSLTIWLDKYSGSGFKSKQAYSSGYFGASMKLQGGYTAGVIASFYLSNNQAHPGDHDEVDIEFLGTIPGRPYTLQTNVYAKGSGDGRVIGREVRFHLWFDPTADFHHYGILWNPDQIIFFVDNVPIRRYPRKSDATYPTRPMWAYGSIWDASSWATDGGRYKADYSHAPFVAKYTRFVLGTAPSGGLTPQQEASLRWAQGSYVVYNYCADAARDKSLTPECLR